MTLDNSDIKKIMESRKRLEIPQERISKVFGKTTRAWWSKAERKCQTGEEQKIEVSSGQLKELNCLLKFDAEEALHMDRDPMVFNESKILEAVFQEAQSRDFLLTEEILEYISKMPEDKLSALRGMVYHFEPEFLSYKELLHQTLIVAVKEELGKAIQTKFPDEDSLRRFFDVYERKVEEVCERPFQKARDLHSSKSDANEYIRKLKEEKMLELITDALAEELSRNFRSALKAAVRRCLFMHFKRKSS